MKKERWVVVAKGINGFDDFYYTHDDMWSCDLDVFDEECKFYTKEAGAKNNRRVENVSSYKKVVMTEADFKRLLIQKALAQ